MFVFTTNSNPYQVFVKPSQYLEEVIDTSTVDHFLVYEVKIFKFGIKNQQDQYWKFQMKNVHIY
jgi:penicillin-binding protein-related factor A (putative recombinase)